MATTRRDIELLISAKETTGRSFKQVTANIDALNTKIGEQVAAAERGEISLQELRNTQEQLAQAGRDLSQIQGQIDAYNRLVATSDKVGAAAEKARNDLAALKAEVEQAGEATARQEQKMQRLENAVVKTSAAVEKNKTDIAEQVAVLERAGVATEKLDTAQAGIVNTARQVGAGLSQVNAAVDGFSINLQQARDAEQQMAAQAGFEKKIADARRLGDASRLVQLFAQSVNTVNAADNELAALTGFRAVGQMAVEASRDMSRFVDVGQSMATSSSQVAAGLRALVDPGQAALQTLSGVEAAIEKADIAAADGVKNVGLLNDAYNQLSASSAALLRQGSLVDQFRDQEAATAAARAQFQQAQADVQRYGTAMASGSEITEKLANSLKQAEARLETTGRELSREETKLGTLSRELKQAGINTSDLAGEQLRLEAAAKRVNGTMERVNTTLGRGGRKTTGLFGLKPNDLANLNFQIQDIVVSLQSGQNPLTVLIQQGSQISQIFPGLISAGARFLLVWSPIIAVVAAVGYAMFLAAQNASRLSDAQNQLAESANGINYEPEKVVEMADALTKLGASYEEAAEAIRIFTDEGLDTDKIEKYSAAAVDLSQRLGIDVAEAANLLNDINVGGIEQLDTLQAMTRDLTQAEYEHAESLFEAGKAAEARQYILDIVAQRNQDIADRSRSIWTPAVNNLKQAFVNFGDFLASVIFGRLTTLRKELDNIAIGAAYVFGVLSGKGLDGARADARAVYDTIQARDNSGPVGGGSTPQEERDRLFERQLDEELASTRDLTAAERLRRVEVEARREAQEAGVSASLQERAVQQAIAAEQKKINEENARSNRRSNAASNRAARAAAAEERRRQAALRQLENQLRQLSRAALSGASASLEERLTAIDEKYENIADTLTRVRALGITQGPDGQSLADIEAQIEAQKQRLKTEETISFYREQAGLLERQRQGELQQIEDARVRGAITTQEAMEAAEEVVSRLGPRIVEAADKAYFLAREIAGVTPSPELEALLSELDRLVQQEGVNRTVADVGLRGFEEESDRLNTLLRERDELVQSYQTLYELGLRTDTEVRQLTAEAYAQQAQAIEPVLTKLREQVELLHNTIDPLTGLPVISDTAYNAWLAKLEAVNAGLANIDPRLTQINSAVRQSIGQGVVTAFNAAADAIVGLVGGTQSIGEAFENLGRTALSIFGSILDAIAQVLIQMVALQVMNALLPGSGTAFSFLFHDGGIVGGRGASRQTRTGGMGSWLGAPKFHGGGGLGLRPDEYKAVLKRGEEVLTEDDPRHIRNLGQGGGGGGGNEPSLRQVLLLDPAAVPNAMQSRAGQKAVLTVIRQNKETLKQVLK